MTGHRRGHPVFSQAIRVYEQRLLY